uniref:Uncharacterized protein n=1 Tax=Rousettus aegyptiacus TaxID=9407 RepID=A0A7J8F0Y0_ROUAE|nr:hypothetical protein HJG63_012364 [Rousettus aegyptiacus]
MSSVYCMCVYHSKLNFSVTIYLTPFTFITSLPPHFSLVTIKLLSVSMSLVCLACLLLSVLYLTYECNYVVLNFFSLVLLSMIIARSTRVVTNDSISSFLMTNMPSYIWTTSSLYSHLSKATLVVSMFWPL